MLLLLLPKLGRRRIVAAIVLGGISVVGAFMGLFTVRGDSLLPALTVYFAALLIELVYFCIELKRAPVRRRPRRRVVSPVRKGVS